MLAEVEFDTREASERFEPPDWLGREVTDDASYGNRSLAECGRPA
jgi:CYTH domain-containing protein